MKINQHFTQMKNVKITLVLITALLFVVGCGEKPVGDPHEHDPIMDTVPKPDIIISVLAADSLYKNYGSDRASFLDETINQQNPDLEEGYDPTRFVTVEFDVLSQYMKYVSQQSAKAGVTPKGIRFYLGQIGSESQTDAIDPGPETIFFNPTAAFPGITGDISYALQIDPAGNYRAVTVGSVIDAAMKNPQDQKGANLLLQGQIESLAGDRVGFPPPPHPGDENDYH